MKKKIIILGIIVFVLIIGGVIALMFLNPSDSSKFKKEYESLNNEKGYMDVTIPSDNNIKYAEFSEVKKFLKEGTGILYLGFPECPWCRNAVPVLLKAAKANEVTDILYFNAKPIRDEKELKDGKIVTKTKGTKEYYELVDMLKDVLGPYEGLNDDSIKRIYFPTAVFVMGGKITGAHVGTVDSQTDPHKHLTKKQEKELTDIYTKEIEKIYGVCDKSC